MIIKSLDNVDVDVTFCDAGYAPGSHPFPILNRNAVWCKPVSGEWFRSRYSSAMETSSFIRRLKAKDLAAAISDQEKLNEGSKASGSGEGPDVSPELQSLQGHSVSDADKGSAGKS